jgi:predicted nucleic acid-binding protein
MSREYPEPVVLDTTVLSNFASTDGISLLTTVLESPVVVPTVRDELESGLDAGHNYLAPAVDALDDGLPLRPAPTDENFQDIRDRLDPGEAASLRTAIEYSGTLATDDLAARKIANQRDVPVTGSIGLLVLGVKAGHLDRDTADAWLDTWREQRGYHAPVETVTELLDDET